MTHIKNIDQVSLNRDMMGSRLGHMMCRTSNHNSSHEKDLIACDAFQYHRKREEDLNIHYVASEEKFIRPK